MSFPAARAKKETSSVTSASSEWWEHTSPLRENTKGFSSTHIMNSSNEICTGNTQMGKHIMTLIMFLW